MCMGDSIVPWIANNIWGFWRLLGRFLSCIHSPCTMHDRSAGANEGFYPVMFVRSPRVRFEAFLRLYRVNIARVLLGAALQIWDWTPSTWIPAGWKQRPYSHTPSVFPSVNDTWSAFVANRVTTILQLLLYHRKILNKISRGRDFEEN